MLTMAALAMLFGGGRGLYPIDSTRRPWEPEPDTGPKEPNERQLKAEAKRARRAKRNESQKVES
jgi:hypothetical protein